MKSVSQFDCQGFYFLVIHCIAATLTVLGFDVLEVTISPLCLKSQKLDVTQHAVPVLDIKALFLLMPQELKFHTDALLFEGRSIAE